MSNFLSLYVHVPFCAKRCAYCHFEIKVLHPRTDRGRFELIWCNAVLAEMERLSAVHDGRSLGSVYLGGGTPSRLSPETWRCWFTGLRRFFSVAEGAEITVELNPEDVTSAYVAMLRDLGVNRFSLGVQSFDDGCLAAVGRIHDSARAQEALSVAVASGASVSMDLMLGLPRQKPRMVLDDLERAVDLGVDHLSIYMLERDLPTPLDKLAVDADLPDEDVQADMYEQVVSRAEALSFQHYEVSNFGRPGAFSRHNLNYWRMGDYLGVGPAAHGRVGLRYVRNHAGLSAYAAAVKAEGSGAVDVELWDRSRFESERLLQGLRLMVGVPLDWWPAEHKERLATFCEDGLLRIEEDRVCLTVRGCLLANEVWSSLI